MKLQKYLWHFIFLILIQINDKECIDDMNKKGVLLVFAKSPEVGKVKTRLIPEIGVDAATDLYRELLTMTLNTSTKSCFPNKQLWLGGNLQHSFFRKESNLDSFIKVQQFGKDLGEKMFNAFEGALREYNYAVLIGSDCPGLTNNDLKFATRMLESDKDIVLGPAEDGGYYLIGLKNNNINLFHNIEWGSHTVLSRTISIAGELNLNIGLLPKRKDIDRFADIQSFEEMKKRNGV